MPGFSLFKMAVKEKTIAPCLCWEGVRQLCRQFVQCGGPPDNSAYFQILFLGGGVGEIYCGYIQRGPFQGSRFNWEWQVSPHDWYEQSACWDSHDSRSPLRLNIQVIVSSDLQKDLAMPPTWIWISQISHFGEQHFPKLCHFLVIVWLWQIDSMLWDWQK